MGMSASQARLLSLTARLSDLELKAQNIQNSKIRLSDQSEAVSRAYTEALNKEKLTVYNSATNSNIDATAKNLTTYGTIPNTTPRMLKDSYGRVLVDDKVKQAYESSNKDLSTFLNAMGYSNVSSQTIETTDKGALYNKLATDISAGNQALSNAVTNTFTTNYNDSKVFEYLTKNCTIPNEAWQGGKVSYNNNGTAIPYCFYADGKNGAMLKNSQDLSNAITALDTTINNVATNVMTGVKEVLKSSFGDKYSSISGSIDAAAKNAITKTKSFYKAELTADKLAINKNAEGNNDTTKSKVSNTNKIYDDTDGNHELYIDLNQVIKTCLTYFDSACVSYMNTSTDADNSIDTSAQASWIEQRIKEDGTNRTYGGGTGTSNELNIAVNPNLKSSLTNITTDITAIKGILNVDLSDVTNAVNSYTDDSSSIEILKTNFAALSLDTIKTKITEAAVIGSSDLGESISNNNNSKYDTAAISYYTNLFNEMKENSYFSESDKNMNSSEWLYTQLNFGNLYLSVWDPKGGEDSKGAYSQVAWKSGDSSLKTEINDADLAKAEAAYNTSMADIETKDKRFDLQLKAIDTEHNAAQTEVESVKKVIDKNIEKSFKIFDA